MLCKQNEDIPAIMREIPMEQPWTLDRLLTLISTEFGWSLNDVVELVMSLNGWSWKAGLRLTR